jgi:hypothetical protein
MAFIDLKNTDVVTDLSVFFIGNRIWATVGEVCFYAPNYAFQMGKLNSF